MTALAQALLAFQKNAPAIGLDATNDHFHNKFPSLAGVVSAIRPILNEHGLVYTQFPTNIDGAPALETMLIHAESGEDIAAVTPLILAKNDMQGYGSAMTYARRYALLSILGLVGDEDDDANSAQLVQARQTNGTAAAPPDPGEHQSRADAGTASDKQKAMIRRLAKKLNLETGNVDALSKSEASARIEELLNAEKIGQDLSAVGATNDLDDIPF